MKKNTTINFSTNTGRSIRVKDFMNTAFKTFSLHDNVRSIPALTDGLKVSQRKAIFGTLTRGENADEVQVERLSAQIAQCFTGDTLILMSDRSYKTIQTLVNDFEKGSENEIMSYDLGGNFISAPVTNAFMTKMTSELIELNFGSTNIRCTPEHLFLTDRGWVQAVDLTLDDNVISFEDSDKYEIITMEEVHDKESIINIK